MDKHKFIVIEKKITKVIDFRRIWVSSFLQQRHGIKRKKTRTGIFTTGIVSVVGDKRIALFFIGRKHAGENFDDLHKQRESDRGSPLQMCDAKTGNTLKSTSAIVCNCNTHARRYFVNVSENFPDECAYVILDVYKGNL